MSAATPTAVGSILGTGPEPHSGIVRFVWRAFGSWLALASLLAVALPTSTALFGSQRRDGVLDPAGPALESRLDSASQLVVSRLAWIRSDLSLVGATNTVAEYLRQPSAATRAALSHDLSAFVAGMSGCRRIVLAPAAGVAVVADWGTGSAACGHVPAAAATLPNGVILLEQAEATAAAGARLCIGMSLTIEGDTRAALVAEYEPREVFGDLTTQFPGSSGPFLREGRGRWVIAPPFEAGPLTSRTFVLPSWQGPSAGRWDIALARGTGAAEEGRPQLPVGAVGVSLLASAFLALAWAYVVGKRRSLQDDLRAHDESA